MKQHLTQFSCYVAALYLSAQFPAQDLSHAAEFLVALSITAFIVSFKHEFAAFSKKDWWQKAVLQYGQMVLLGFFTPVAWRGAHWAGIALFACSALMHLASWNNPLDSDDYLQRQLRDMGLHKTLRLVARLNGCGLSNEGRKIMNAIFQEKAEDEKPETTLDLMGIQKQIAASQQWLIKEAAVELAPYVKVIISSGIGSNI